MKTAPISPLVRDVVLDALAAAGRNLRDATLPDAPPASRGRAAEAIEWSRWVAELVRHDEHDSIMHLRIGDVIVALEDIAPAMTSGLGMLTAARHLRTAGLLLQSARREADLARRLGDILPIARDITDTARKDASEGRTRDIIIAGNDIAKLARA